AADVVNSASFEIFAATLGIGEKRIAAVDHHVAFFKKGDELTDHLIDRFAGLDHDHDLARLLESAEQLFNRMSWMNIFPFSASGGEFVGDFGGAIENGNVKALRFHVEDEVFAHHRQSDQANITLIRAHFQSPLLQRRRK